MIHLVRTTEDVERAYNFLQKIPTIGADTETTGLDPYDDRITLIQLGTADNQFVFDMARIPEEAYSRIFEILESREIKKIFQNAAFDYKFIKENYGVTCRNIVDTMIMEQLLTKGVKMHGFGLGELAEKYRAGKMDKSVRKDFIGKKYGDDFSKEEIHYAANDVKVLLKIYGEQLRIANSRKILPLVDLENRTVAVTAQMELNGIYIDQEAWTQLEATAVKDREAAKKRLQKHFEKYYPLNLFGNIDINFSSPAQMKKALEQVLGHPVEKTDSKYLKQFNHPVLDDLKAFKQADKLISTYGVVFLENVHPMTSRIHARYLQLGTDSGRMSCTKPNMQNIPSDQPYRTPFCAQKEGWKIISADFASQELRVLAQLCKEPSWLKAIDEGRDLHRMVASIMFGVLESEVTDVQRKRAKALGFGTIYGMSAYALSKNLEIAPSDAKVLLNTFFKSFPRIKAFLDHRENETARLKCAVSPLDGRTRDLGNIDWDDHRKRGHALNIGKNHPIQGVSASITKLALINVQEYIDEHCPEAMIIAVIHDEILVECPGEKAQEMADAVSKGMIDAFNYYCPDVPMVVKPDISDNWVH